MCPLMRQPLRGRSLEYADNRIYLFCAQWGKCAITGFLFRTTSEIHCHHIKPRQKGGDDEYGNLMLVHDNVHALIHATRADTVNRLLLILALNDKQI